MLIVSFTYRAASEAFATGQAQIPVETDNPAEALELAVRTLADRKPTDISHVEITTPEGNAVTVEAILGLTRPRKGLLRRRD